MIFAAWALNFSVIAFRNSFIQIIVLALRILVFVLAGMPMGADAGVETILLAAALVDFMAFPRPGIGAVASPLLLLTAVAVQHPVVAWGVEMPRPAAESVILLAAVGSLVFFLMCVLVHQSGMRGKAEEDARRLTRSVDQLTEANLGFQKYALSVGNSSVLEERNRFSREIHDTIGYTLTNLIIMIEACQDLMKTDQDGLRRMLVRAGELAQEGLGDTRKALHALRRRGVEEERGIPAIRKLVDTFHNATGVEVGVEYGNIPWNMDENLERTLFRFIQEGMINSFKHGKAGRILISLWQDERSLVILLQDNGSGSKDLKEGIGISGMRERVESLGGEISAGNITGGFELSARIPVDAIRNADA